MFTRIKRETIINIVRHGVYLLVLYVLQAAVLPWFGFGFVPVLLAVGAAGVSHFENGENGAVFCLFSGLLCDIALGRPTVVFTVALTIIGLLSGWLGETLFSRRFPSYMLCCLMTMIIVSFIQMFSHLFFRGAPIGPLLITAALQTAASLLLAVPMYPVAKWLARSAREA